MAPKQTPPLSDFDLYRSHFNQILNQRHELILLGKAIDWSIFDREFGPLYDAAHGRPGLPTRLMVGLHFLKHMFNESDESTCAKWVENPYWQAFCGFEYFQHVNTGRKVQRCVGCAHGTFAARLTVFQEKFFTDPHSAVGRSPPSGRTRG